MLTPPTLFASLLRADFGEHMGLVPHVFTMMLDVAANDGTDWIMGGVGIPCPESDVARPDAGQNRHTTSDEAKQVAAAARANATSSASAAVAAASASVAAGAAVVAAPAASSGNATPAWFLPFMRENYERQPGGAELVRVFEAILANGKVTPLPQYHFAAPRVVNKRVVLVGDAAHMGVPRTAVGAHTAVLDGMALLEA